MILFHQYNAKMMIIHIIIVFPLHRIVSHLRLTKVTNRSRDRLAYANHIDIYTNLNVFVRGIHIWYSKKEPLTWWIIMDGFRGLQVQLKIYPFIFSMGWVGWEANLHLWWSFIQYQAITQNNNKQTEAGMEYTHTPNQTIRRCCIALQTNSTRCQNYLKSSIDKTHHAQSFNTIFVTMSI